MAAYSCVDSWDIVICSAAVRRCPVPAVPRSVMATLAALIRTVQLRACRSPGAGQCLSVRPSVRPYVLSVSTPLCMRDW